MKHLSVGSVMTESILTADADWSVQRLSEFLVENGISGAPVTDSDGAVLGVVSFADIVRHDSLREREPKARRPPAFYLQSLEDQFAVEELDGLDVQTSDQVRVREIMTPEVFAVEADATVAAVAGMMVTGRIHRVLVTDGNRLVGLVSALDLLSLLQEGAAITSA